VSLGVLAALGALGGLGAIARMLLDGAVSSRAGREFPWGTLAVNVSGAFALGVLAGADVGGDAFRLAGTGFVGAYTTFSTWMFETHRLAEDGHGRAAAANLAVSLAAGVAMAFAGHALGTAL
jgi:fluoride exporter